MNEVEKLRQIKSMGDTAAHSVAESMAALFGLEVNMKISSVNMVAVDTIPRLIGLSEDDVVAGSYISFSGFLNGSVLCVLTINSAREISDIMMAGMDDEPEPGAGIPFSDMQQSAIIEFTNIITSSFIDVYANTLSTTVDQSPPSFACDYMGSLLEVSLIDASKKGDFAFMFDTVLDVTDRDIELEVLVLPEMDSLQVIFDNLPEDSKIPL
ncbi:MAG: chemotaxis protein CheC [Halobacteriota archaeon]|nr:chemotaxis protein CheC [Halobacteriota archaeon]